MPQKKSILVYCERADVLSEMAVVLRLHSYEVTTVSDDNSAVRAAKKTRFACGLLVHTEQGDQAGRLIHRILNYNPKIPLLLVDLVGDLAPVRHADLVLYRPNTRTAHVLAALQVLCVNQTGPRGAA